MRWIIGDVHGMLRPLERLLEQVGKVDSRARFYFVGDFVNRGPDSRGTIEMLMKMSDAKFIRGNHDDIFDLVINNESYATNAANGDRLVAFQWFMDHGIDSTFESYGVDYAVLEQCQERGSVERLEKIVAAIPESHKKFIRGLGPLIEEEDLFIAHAKWDPYDSDVAPSIGSVLEKDAAARHRLLWGRFSEEEIGRVKAWKRTGYFGHTPVYAYAASQKTGELLMLPIAGSKLMLVDTGGVLSAAGRLTAFCADDQTFVQVDHFGKVIEVG